MGKKTSFDFCGLTITVEEKCPSCTTHMPQRNVAPSREPMGGEGIMVAVQKPQREFYGGWNGESVYRDHLRKYNRLEDAAKACDWPNDLIDSGAIQWPVPQHNVATRPTPSYRPTQHTTTTRSEREVRTATGRVPLGAKVSGYTWDGQPIFTL